MIHIDDVPFDVWSHVTSFSSMKCISNLRCVRSHSQLNSRYQLNSLFQTSKHFYRLMSERSVWLDALRDVLEVIPLPRLRHVLPCLSSSELRTKAAMISRLDDLWSRGASHPAHIESYRPSSGIIAIEIMPGGDWVLNLFQDGSLHLHHRRNMAEHSVSVPLPTRSGWRFEGSAYMRRSFSSCGQHWVAVKDYYVTSEYVRSSVRQFRSIHLLSVTNYSQITVYTISMSPHLLSAFCVLLQAKAIAMISKLKAIF
jgi:hypothetical protein